MSSSTVCIHKRKGLCKMADKFKISGSNTGDYYKINNGKREYYDKNNKPLEESVFLEKNNAEIAKDGSMRKKENAKEKLVKIKFRCKT